MSEENGSLTDGQQPAQPSAPAPAPAPEPEKRLPAPLTSAQAVAEMDWLRVMRVTGAALFESGLFGLQNVPQGLVMCIKARDLGVTPTYILDRFWPVTAGGRTTLMPKGDAVVAKFYERGGRIELKTSPTDREKCDMTLTGPAPMASKVEVHYTIEDAKRENAKAFESDRGIWRTRPHRQLFRAAAKIGIGIIDPQTFVEIGEADDEMPEPVEPAATPSLREVRAELVEDVTPALAAPPPPAVEPQPVAPAPKPKGRPAKKADPAPDSKPPVEPEKKLEAGAVGGRLQF